MDRHVRGLRVFLLTTLSISKNQNVSCATIEENLASGIATKLFQMFQKEYKAYGIDDSMLEDIDEYNRQWNGCVDGQEKNIAVQKMMDFNW